MGELLLCTLEKFLTHQLRNPPQRHSVSFNESRRSSFVQEVVPAGALLPIDMRSILNAEILGKSCARSDLGRAAKV